ncbi:23S rRNA (uracil(1939)-C(5))-methyltransferase RlmD [Herbaspirillum sp. RTI4]|uniref:23S rRNA (uracil(1939)-C(5))-methyltransferase RlmD n=1 Tax=Herbaspirillum sp. RTI4 TaxID=3048640 RepID=UPI002AB38C52|nr:23S rRNA (uracil(1939)-C(5))-methyltransferase RlmD [Herbaspirillum sp. RTI4]MDY7578603.1 23S rRNA (uracil(1939)-C(5))-methyltransferase RlmD [Herbaspirillum sp. RTI4]MEA9981091.1 23S rRNA (uracil(1939)-C(5))-methyltransferase RlmD [Herbaspirillum sp. RTI4]
MPTQSILTQSILDIESLDMEGRGIGHLANEDGSPGKVVFVEGALPGERVAFHSFRKKAKWEAANMTALLHPSSQRVTPRCPAFGMCGGCAMQHLEPAAQVAVKQRALEDSLAHIGKVRPDMMMRPIHGPTWGYRYRARLSVRNVKKRGGVLVGFHEKKSAFITDMSSCAILPPNVSALLIPLRRLIESLTIVDHLPQIELAIGEEDGKPVTIMVLRIMAPLGEGDEGVLHAFADLHAVQWWLQPQGPDSAYPYYPAQTQLHYTLPDFGIRMPFRPTDFTQVNHQINRVLVAKALRLLDVQAQDRVADLFCGLGNFTLPIATQASAVVGIEGSTALTVRALENARLNGLEEKTVFHCRNLFEATTEDLVALGKFDRMLIDPPREGAFEICKAIVGLGALHPELKPQRIVYVSCNPGSLARDAGLLVEQGAYRLTHAGVVNMFPHTAHVESIAVFDLIG